MGRTVAAGLGAEHTVAMGPDTAGAIRDACGGRRADVVLDCVGANETLAVGAAVTVPLGHLTIVGLAGGVLPVGFFGVGDEVSVATTDGGTSPELVEVLALAKAQRIRAPVERFSPDQAPEADAGPRAGTISGRAAVVPSAPNRRSGGTAVSPSVRLHWPAGSLATETWALELTPERAGWSCAGLRVADLGAGARVEFTTGGTEMAVLPLAGSVVVEVGGRRRLALAGRSSVFAAVSDWAYLPVDTEVALVSSGGCSVALPFAPATRRFDAVRVAATEVAVEVRGAGSCTRQVTNFMSPDRFAGAQRLICVEVLTPDGNWSSYPPHKHDDSPECPVNNEEIYYFRVGRSGSTEPCADGVAAHRTYTADRSIDECVAVGDGDLFCVPRGYHGPSMAAPGYPLYYLNVLASPGDLRSLAFCDDPVHHWVRERWAGERPDPRCPMTSAHGEHGAGPG